MTTPQEELVRYRMERAWETLEEARLMFSSNHLHGAANRLYYACFYAVNALLAQNNMASSRHSGVASLFHRYFVKNKIVPVEFGKFYSKIFDDRTEGDYADMTSEIPISQQDFQTAKAFVEYIAQMIKQRSD